MHRSNSPQLFEEEQWLLMVFLLSDTQAWINEQQRHLLQLVPLPGKKKLLRNTYYVTAASLAHIAERHYVKTNRHPGTGKFTIPVPEILACLRDLADAPTLPIPGSPHLQRSGDAGRTIGYDKLGNQTRYVTVLTDTGGRVVTAFPGKIHT